MSSYYNQQQSAPAAPAAAAATKTMAAEGYPVHVAPPPPLGYPMKDGAAAYPEQVPVETSSREGGFWKGCCAALCCCCVLDACF